MKPERILIVDADEMERGALRDCLDRNGFHAVAIGDAREALALLSSFLPDAVLWDAERLGPELVARARAEPSGAAIVIGVRPDRIDSAVAALRAGAESYLVKPIDPRQALVVLEKVLEKRRLERERGELREQMQRRAPVGDSPELVAAQETARRAAPTHASILLQGEPGTGKALLAEAIHEASPRRHGPFVIANCAAVSEVLLESQLFGQERGSVEETGAPPEGQFEQANGGTLFLRGVNRLALGAQLKLLRVLQEERIERVGGRDPIGVDVRVISAAHCDLGREVRSGRFREDLYRRLGVVTLSLPPLRARKSDIPALAQHFLARYALAHGRAVQAIGPSALSALLAHDWPGNVRELASMVERAVLTCPGKEIKAGDLSLVLHRARPAERAALIPGASLFAIEREAILRTLELVGGSTARAAALLGVSVRKIQYRLKTYRSGPAARR